MGDCLEVKIADFGLSAICELGGGGYDSDYNVKLKKYAACREVWGTKVSMSVYLYGKIQRYNFVIPPLPLLAVLVWRVCVLCRNTLPRN